MSKFQVISEAESADKTIPRRFNKKHSIIGSVISLLLIAGSFVGGWFLPSPSSRGKDVEPVSVDEIENLYDLLNELTDRLDEWGVEYWLLGGSLVGALRNLPPGPMAVCKQTNVSNIIYIVGRRP